MRAITLNRTVSAVVVVASVTLLGSAPTHAASLTGILAQPINAANNLLQQVVTPVVSVPSPTAPTVAAPTSAAVPSAAPAMTQSATPATTAQTSAASTEAPVAATPSSAATPVTTATAANQGVASVKGASYMSNQLTQSDADALYRNAGIAAIIGFAIYAATAIPHTPGRFTRFVNKVKSPLKVKTNHS